MGRLFGTDGVRGIANAELSCDLALKIGAAGAHALTSEVHSPKILIGCDTRKSGDMLCSALTAGICSVGGDAIHVGIIPTPAMAYLVRQYGADAAVMVSASHNPMEFNGIKWFDGEGYKLSDELEDQIERIVREQVVLPRPTGSGVGRLVHARRAQEEYTNFLIAAAETRFEGLRVVLDCANGASSVIAKEVFRALGAQTLSYSDEPDGNNINELCGSTNPQRLTQLVTELGADVGFAFDGDADRLIAVDECGNVVDGDRIMGICALDRKSTGALKNDTLVITSMSNLGLKKRMKQAGISIAETAVGDRYVLECMLKNGYCLGGEQSGHVIFLEKNTTGDGMLTAVELLNVLKKRGVRMSELASEVPIYPQILINVKVDNVYKNDMMQDEELLRGIREAEGILGDSGRVLVRASGTEPLIRIMLEGDDEEQIHRLGIGVAKILEQKYGGTIKNT